MLVSEDIKNLLTRKLENEAFSVFQLLLCG